VGEPFTGVAAEPPADGKLVVGVPAPPPTGAAAGADVGALAGGVGDVVPGGLAPGAVPPGATATTWGTGDGAVPCAKSHVHDALVVDPAGCMNPWLPPTLPLEEP